ncbi:hypothetical protein [Stieleria mannarensis]|uniref:hypothetical protein n=1 Tax=Stieleria mannarensis TaxID=2755585 RepID=UPI0015FEF8D0|nr:hypothetical protein [Rhodopirellula sp. JC639]
MSRQSLDRVDGSPKQGLAAKMLAVLSRHRPENADSEFLTLDQLGRLADSDANSDLVQQAARTKCFATATIAARGNDTAAPVARLEDLELLAKSSQLLQYVMSLFDKNKTRAYTVAKLKSKLSARFNKRLQVAFQSAVLDRLATGQMYPGFGYVVAGGARPHLFRLADLHPAQWRAAIDQSDSRSPQPPTSLSQSAPANRPLTSFSQQFDAAFEQLDREQGSYNFVNLAALRAALPSYSREEFDSQLRQLRLSRRIRLSGAENRNDVSPQQRAAGIQEAGSLLLYAQRIVK